MSIWNAPCNPADERGPEVCTGCEELPIFRDNLCADCYLELGRELHGKRAISASGYERIERTVYAIGSNEPVHVFATITEAVAMLDLLEAAVPPWEALETVFSKRRERRCGACQTWTKNPHGICMRCVDEVYRPNRMWCDIHGACWQDFCAGCANGPTKGKR